MASVPAGRADDIRRYRRPPCLLRPLPGRWLSLTQGPCHVTPITPSLGSLPGLVAPLFTSVQRRPACRSARGPFEGARRGRLLLVGVTRAGGSVAGR